MHMKITRASDLENRRILKRVLGNNVALAQGHSSMATFCEYQTCDSFCIHWLLQTMDHWNE